MKKERKKDKDYVEMVIISLNKLSKYIFIMYNCDNQKITVLKIEIFIG